MTAGCADGTTPDPGPTASPAPELTPTPTPEQTADDAAAVVDVFERYLDAVVAMENGPEPDPALLFGIATDDVTGEHVRRAADLGQDGLRRVGEPQVGEPEVVVDGDEARLEVCVDEDTWTAELADGTSVESTPRGPSPRVYDLVREDGTWLVAALVPQAEATLTC